MREPSLQLFGRAVQRVHCLGVGGTGVAPLAIFLAGLGYDVTGEDDALTAPVRRALERGGVKVTALPRDSDWVVHSSAIPEWHPSLAAARECGIPHCRRGEMLAEVMKGRRLIAVCGAHGKTTTTAMLIWALKQAGVNVGYLLGGLFQGETLPPADTGDGEWVVAEIDESDGTIEGFAPEITVATNLDWDHPDQYPDHRALEEAYAALFSRTKGVVVLSDECPVSGRMEGNFRRSTFGEKGEFRVRIVDAGKGACHQRLSLGGAFPEREFDLRAWGRFNALNAAAALAAVQLAGFSVSGEAMAKFPGVRRRQAVLTQVGNVTVIEDYAHHPAEIGALLDGVRERIAGGGCMHVVFQPHRFTRTAQFRDAFADVLVKADKAYLLEVYPAGELPVAGGTSEDLAEACDLHEPPVMLAGRHFREDWKETLTSEVRHGDWVVFVGAGDIDQRARVWIEEHEARCWDAWVASLRPRLSGGSRLVREEPLGSKTTMRAGGAARVYAEPTNEEDVAILLRAARDEGVRWFVLGRGSNLLIPDDGVDGLVIALQSDTWSEFRVEKDGRVWVGAGLRLRQLCGLAAKAGLGGFEFLEGIPATVGGALRMNAGAMNGWTFDVVDSVRMMAPDGTVRIMRREEMRVDYRHCAELEGMIALGAWLKPAPKAASQEILQQMEAYRLKRHETQPREPSAGCMFKNPPGDSAGRLIDGCGLKGQREGDAEVSPIHANFIVNRGEATATDILALVRRVRRTVRERAGVTLEPEVQLLGRDWNEFL